MNGRVVQRLQTCFDIYLLYIALAMLVIGWHDTHTQIGWTLGDWLINYHGGFVRRGLIGELVLHAARLLHVSPVQVVAGQGIVLYGLLLYSVRELLCRSSLSTWVVYGLLSPATLAFGVLDDRAGYHKELLFLVSLGLVLLALTKKDISDVSLTVGLSIVCVLCILCHEPLLVYMPYYMAALVLGKQSWRRGLQIGIIPFLLSVMCFYAACRYPGSPEVADHICNSLRAYGPEVCNGAISYMSYDITYARRDLLTDVEHFHYYRLYSMCAVLSLVPVLMAGSSFWKNPKMKRDLMTLGILSLSSISASLSLFLFATDWGRWIHIHIFSLFLLFLFLDSRSEPQEMDKQPIAFLLQNPRQAALAGILLVAYACLWSMPHYGNNPTHGYVDMFSHFLGHAHGLVKPGNT